VPTYRGTWSPRVRVKVRIRVGVKVRIRVGVGVRVTVMVGGGGHRRYVDDANGGRPHSSIEPAGPCPLRHRQQPAQGEACTCE